MGSEAKLQLIESFQTHPDTYRHWSLQIDGAIATLALEIQEENGLRPDDYTLKQNSYDMGVDMELNDAVQRLRFEHPEVRAVVVTSKLPKIFCAGANIRMLATSAHGFKVNFCKYTNETRCDIEDSTKNSGQVYLAALNGTAAGGGYELALACEEIYLIDDGSSVVSLPEVPLLGVLPGTGGLTRLVDKRMVRRDLADVFCTKAEGFRARDAMRYELIDGSFPRSKWVDGIQARADAIVAANPPVETEGILLPPLQVKASDGGRDYKYVSLRFDKGDRVAHLEVRAPDEAPPANAAALRAQGANSWSMQVYRELENAIHHLRFNHPTLGLILLSTRGDSDAVIAHDAVVHENQDDWFARELQLYQGRVLRKVDNTSRSIFAIIDEGSCFSGSLFELTIAADRSYMLEDEDGDVKIRLTKASSGLYTMAIGESRLAVRFAGNPDKVGEVLAIDKEIDGPEAFELGLVTMVPDDIDWEDELRIAVEERVSLSPDALTGMEQNLRFVGRENCDTKIFGRLTAWQNWIFQRPNAVGETGALTMYGHPERPRFDWRRT